MSEAFSMGWEDGHAGRPYLNAYTSEHQRREYQEGYACGRSDSEFVELPEQEDMEC